MSQSVTRLDTHRAFVHHGVVLTRVLACGVLVSACGRFGFDRAPAGNVDAAPMADGSPTTDPLSAFDDSFDGSGLEPDWSVLNPNDLGFVVEGGVLTITPTGTGYWFNGAQGGLVYKVVTGDFIVTAEVSVENFVTPGIPTASNCLGLVLARDPIAPPQNNVWIGVGAVSNQWSVEPKSTVNGVTEYARTDWSQRAILRICRIGTSFRMLAREPTSSVWSRDVEYIRPNLPSALQVGIAASCSNSPLDLEARFEAIAFATPAGRADCIGP